MRINHSYHPDYGASPEPVFEYDLDPYTAGQMLSAAQKSRAAFRAAAEAHFDACADLDLLPDNIGPRDQARARFLACVDELVDDWLHQGKLEEAGEIA